MALVHFLYRCPFCGHDPLEGEGGAVALCSGCGRRYEQGEHPGRIRVTAGEGEVAEILGFDLSRKLSELGGPIPRAERPDGRWVYGAPVEASFSTRETPVRWQSRVMGFFERLRGGVPGELRLDGDRIHFLPGEGEGSMRGDTREWPLLDLRSLQAVSSALQLTGREGELAHFRFRGDSPRRWEDLLRAAIQREWRAAGRGEVVEFQPRIRAVP